MQQEREMPGGFYAQEIATTVEGIFLFLGETSSALFLASRMEMMRLASLRLLLLFFLPKICKVGCHGIGGGDQLAPSQSMQL